MSIKNVGLVGGTGTMGEPILEALKNSSFNLSVLNRASSKSKYPDTHVITVPDDLNVPDVTRLLKENNIDALILAIKPAQVAQNKRLIEAAFNAGVQRVIPAEFGSVDSADAKTREVYPIAECKKEVRDYLISLQDQERGEGKMKLSWTGLVPAHFFDWGLGNLLLCFDVAGRKAYLQDGGDVKFSTSNLPFIAKAVVKVLERPEQTANQLLYIQSFRVSQNEVLAVLEKVTGEKFEIIHQKSEERLKELRPKMLEGDFHATEETVGIWGLVASDWQGRVANELLELEEEDLEETIREVLGKH
ncbi:isoflavone reductase family protein [Bimuria novae-zelandiae CBS 107.79]|uniref:Isoflavone reductase family protein n=1 Tax=Bimuria novae-zelandiae CBS 107.79 TaxID=1447943 RepID=A0A6A5VJZ0_9PLEO|nr:isoflavone reductase family protein [Bimuria novae-zelandiae CBS 107.79]